VVRRVQRHKDSDGTIATRTEHLMEINYNTDRLIILNYPAGAGGKFISLCLALDPAVIHQDEKLARAKIAGKINKDYSFQISKTVLTKSATEHFELGCAQLAGFNLGQEIVTQCILANNLWKELTNQNEFYFFLVDIHGGQWAHYPNSKHILFKNYEWIMKARGLTDQKIHEVIFIKDNIIDFDQSTIKDRTAFKNEMRKLFGFFKYSDPNWDHIEELRSIWIDTFTIGFNNNRGEHSG